MVVNLTWKSFWACYSLTEMLARCKTCVPNECILNECTRHLYNSLCLPAAKLGICEMEEAYSELYQEFVRLRSLCLRQAALLHQLTTALQKNQGPYQSFWNSNTHERTTLDFYLTHLKLSVYRALCPQSRLEWNDPIPSHPSAVHSKNQIGKASTTVSCSTCPCSTVWNWWPVQKCRNFLRSPGFRHV